MAKSRVAPLKPPLDIPKLELQAALIGARLVNFIESELDIGITQRFLWSDNSAVLYWIRSEPRARKVFFANRLGEIAETTEVSEWRWVPSKLNPADDATRFDIKAPLGGSRWLDGPGFLYEPQEKWPPPGTLREEEQLRCDAVISRKVFACAVIAPVSETYSSRRVALGWNGLLALARKVRGKFARWKSRVLNRETLQDDTPVAQIHACEIFWFKKIQGECFEREVKALKLGREIERKSKIAQLKPFLDEEGVLRADGRVTSNFAGDFENRPIILDRAHYATRCIVADYHRRYYHGSTETVVNELRQRFYIIGLRNTLRSIAARCLVCRAARGKPLNPVMAPLPRGRIAMRQRPFSEAGLDYFGPVWVKIGRRREKRWGVLFTCLTTRAISLDLAHTLNASSAIMAIQRLSAERGRPNTIYSDNGTNFQGASKELREAILAIDTGRIVSHPVGRQINWRFNPPDAAHMGGVWERQVRSVKVALSVVLKDQAPSEEVLITVLKEIQHSVNSRPLTHVSVDPRDLEALTPNHFLIGTSSGHVMLGEYDARYINPRKQYRLAQYYADIFWRRWLREYLPTLLPRKKWTEATDPVRVGDIVLIADFQTPRNQWRRGRVTRITPSGADGGVRVADIHTSMGDYTRATHKLVRLISGENVQDY